MRSFIYDQYGYILDKEVNAFFYQGFDFALIAHEMEEDELLDLEEATFTLLENLPFEAKCHIVRDRNKHFRVENEFGPVSLITSLHQEYTPEACLKLMETGSHFKNANHFTISNLIDLWEEKLTIIEEKCITASKIDDYSYPMLISETIYSIGLANNAISYLVDIKHDFGDELSKLTLVHKRLPDLFGINIFNPFNLIMDSSSRDIASLFKMKELEEDGVVKAIKRFNLEPKEVALLMARLLFPTTTFDLLEDQYNIKKDIRRDLVHEFNNSKSDLLRIASLFKILVEKFSLRPIEWIIKY